MISKKPSIQYIWEFPVNSILTCLLADFIYWIKITIGPSFYMNFFSFPSSLHEFFSLAFSLAWIFFGFFPPPPPPLHHFSNGPSLKNKAGRQETLFIWKIVMCREQLCKLHGPVVQGVDNAIHRIMNDYPVDTGGGGGGGGGRGRRLVKFSYQNHPTKINVTSGLIGAQEPVSAKSNHGVWVRHDFYGFLSHQCQEL